ncbi:MAG: hypothetical protein LBM93_12790 [Oscillospiraceae bacterium]|jgi:hypothetical protein|nr:hypothetical protein [Oscillospiraceae bacterium]
MRIFVAYSMYSPFIIMLFMFLIFSVSQQGECEADTLSIRRSVIGLALISEQPIMPV